MSDPYNHIGKYSQGQSPPIHGRCRCDGWLPGQRTIVCEKFEPKHSGGVTPTSHCDNCQHDMRCHV